MDASHRYPANYFLPIKNNYVNGPVDGSSPVDWRIASAGWKPWDRITCTIAPLSRQEFNHHVAVYGQADIVCRGLAQQRGLETFGVKREPV
jgi:hypothetical protein